MPITKQTIWLNSEQMANITAILSLSSTSFNQAYSEYKHVLANILRSRYVARTPPLEARSPGRRSNVENAPRRRPVNGQLATPTSHIRCAILRTPPVTRQSLASSTRRPRRAFALCRHIAGWTQTRVRARYVAIATQPVP